MKKRFNKKSQIHMAESIVVIVIVIVIIILGIVFWRNLEKEDIKEKARQFSDMNAIDLLNTISAMPEFQCSIREVTDTSCVDEMKLKAFTETDVGESAYYAELFSSAKISLNVVYPESAQGETYPIYDSGEPLNYRGHDIFLIPASLYDPVEKGYKFAILNITKYR
jgi:hypothetical protein